MERILKKSAVLTAALVLSVVAGAQSRSAIDWESDLDHLAKTLPELHCNLYAQLPEDYFLSGLEKIKDELPGLNDFETAVRIQQLIARLGDSHTSLNLTPLIDKEQILPLETYWFSDGLYVLATTRGNADLRGCRIDSVNGIDIAAVADSLKTLIAGNEASLKMNFPKSFPSIQLLEFFGFAPGGCVELGYTAADGSPATAVVKPSTVYRGNVVSVRPDSTAFCDMNRKAFFTERYFGDGNIYYLQYNRCRSRELEEKYGKREDAPALPSFGEFEARVFETLRTKPVGKIIFDLRFNGGGSSSQGTNFIAKLSEYLNNRPGTKLYVVLGRSTFSSAILNAMDCKRMADAVFVGEATSGKPNHFGEVRSFRLPGSGLQVSYSTKYFKHSDDNPDTMEPDVLIERTFGDFMKGIDPVFEWIIER